MEREEAFDAIADGHAIYAMEYAKEVLETLQVPWKDIYARHWFNEPDVFKGAIIAPENEGFLGTAALSLGDIALDHYHLTAPSKFGRGSQGRENAQALREYFKANVS
jgi:hypothetical protein